MNPVLRGWSVDEYAVGLYPERTDRHSNVVDRALARQAGRMALWTSPLERRRLRRFADEVLAQGATLESESEDRLRARVAELRVTLPRAGLTQPLTALAFALVREISRRRLGMAHFPVQLMGGAALLRGRVAEMATGEGKSLTGLLPAITVALARVPVHVVTVNEYLAERDATEFGPVLEFFGLSAGWIGPEQAPAMRQAMYARDITWCVNKDLVFDYLKDGLAAGTDDNVRRRVLRRFLEGRAGIDRHQLRGLFFAIVDEADSIFIDEARTPLIISSEQQDAGEAVQYALALELARDLGADGYRIDAAARSARLTAAGRQQVEQACADQDGLWRFRRAREQMVEQALAALHLYLRDTQYVVADGKVHIVDESTGRTMPDRSWEHGLHQIIEAKEGLAVTRRRETISRITYQRFFRRYLWLAGMTGTGAEVAPEVRSVYGVATVRIPTHRPVLRRNLGERVFRCADARWAAVLERIRVMVASGRAVLAGTRSVEASEHLARLLDEAGIAYTLLNARHADEEAAIVAAAGQPGRVTVATNMAGRGTDIKLHPAVREAGGLHVILTEYHESRRIDRQLFGRSGRQGDPGSCESMVSLEDELFRAHAAHATGYIARRWQGREVLPAWLGGMLRRVAQAAAERRNALVRLRTLEGEKHTDRRLAFAGSPE
jgi:preprotein translocase subunit SecA